MNKVLTVTVPSYNVEATLESTVDSLASTSHPDLLEVLIVDDGSKDGTAALGRKLETKYPKVVRLISKQNGGHGSTINTGIKEAKGKYFKVVDGDDWLITENLDLMLERLKESTADVVYNPFFTVHDKTGERELQSTITSETSMNQEVSFDSVSLDIPMHAAIFKTDVLRGNNITIDEHRFYVDAEYVTFPIPWLETILVCSEPLYLYRIFSDTQSMNYKNMQKNVQHHLDVTYHIAQFYEDHKNSLSEKKKDLILARLCQLTKTQYAIYYTYPKSKDILSQIQAFDRTMKSISQEAYQAGMDGSVPFVRKAGWLFYPIFQKRAYRKLVQGQ